MSVQLSNTQFFVTGAVGIVVVGGVGYFVWTKLQGPFGKAEEVAKKLFEDAKGLTKKASEGIKKAGGDLKKVTDKAGEGLKKSAGITTDVVSIGLDIGGQEGILVGGPPDQVGTETTQGKPANKYEPSVAQVVKNPKKYLPYAKSKPVRKKAAKKLIKKFSSRRGFF